MAATTEESRVIQSHNSQEILNEVHKFVTGAQLADNLSRQELAQSAIFLLKSLPSSRAAVLEHLCSVFDEAVNVYLLQLETGRTSPSPDTSLDEVIDDIYQVLTGFITSNPTAWAPIISSWSIELLGQLGSNYAERSGVPDASRLNELMQHWMTCPATRALIDIAAQCIAAMIGHDPDVCITALLDTSAKHSPHFDWVVAHIGSCFPTTMITRVLHCGLKDFCSHGSAQQQQQQQQADFSGNSSSADGGGGGEKVPKIASVVGILGHLVTQHAQGIHKALLTLFQESLQDDVDDFRLATVPYLLHLASLSPMLLCVIATDSVKTLTPDVLNQLAVQVGKWQFSHVQDLDSLLSLVVHLIIMSTDGSLGILQFLINTMALDTGINEKVEKCCTVILDMLVMDLQRMIGMIATWEATRGDIPFLASLLSNQIALCNMLLQPHPQQGLVWLSRILAFVGQYGGEPVAADILHHFLCHGQDSRMASLFQSMSQEMDSQLPNALQRTVDKAFVTLQSQPDMLETLLCNMLTLLLRWRHRRSSNRFAIILRNHVSPLCCHLRSNNRKVSSAAMQCLHLIGHPRLLPLGTMLQLCFGVTAYFFSVLHIKAVEEKLVGVRTCRAYLQSLSEIPGAQHVLLHSLVHGCMLQGQAGPLRSRIPAPPVEKCKVEQTAMACLLEENAHHGHAIILPQSHSSVFHAGIIGKGVQNPPRAAMFTRNEISTNRQLFLDVVQACSLYHPNDETDTMELDIAMETEQLVTAEPGVAALEAIALMLTEMATPDVLYNQIDWPEEAFARCTVERDLVIKKRFHEYPVLWELLDFVSRDRAALLQCSVLLRGIVAILLAYWENCRDSATTASPWQLEASCRVIQIMNQGKLLPLPLSDISILFPLLSSYETHLLLRDVWQYIHENNISQTGIGPGPMPGCSSCHTDTLRSILQLNTSAVGHLYCHFFNTGKQS